MKVFVIPSWYPSASNPIYGTFVHEQVMMMARAEARLHFGVSLWGQGDDPFLLYARQPLRSLAKVLKNHPPSREESGQVSVYFAPAYTWTRRLLRGNIKGILAANKANLARFVADHGRPDVLHVQASYPGAWIGRDLSRRYGIPYVVTLRMSPFPFAEYLDGAGRMRPALYDVLSHASLLIATSSSLEDRVRALGLDRVMTIHNPVDLDFFHPADEMVSGDGYRLLAVGRLEEQKGFDLLIGAMAGLQPDIRLDILGEGSGRAGLEALISRYELGDRVTLHGQADRDEVRRYMQACHGYVLSSRHETFGNVLVEAMASGKPCVATRCGGPTDILSGQTGIYCDPDSEGALRVAIQALIHTRWDPHAIRAEAVSRFHPVSFTDRMMAAYERCVSG